jgi:hypothetical protein
LIEASCPNVWFEVVESPAELMVASRYGSVDTRLQTVIATIAYLSCSVNILW